MIVNRLTFKQVPDTDYIQALAILHKLFPTGRVLSLDTGPREGIHYVDLEHADYAAYQQARTAFWQGWATADEADKAALAKHWVWTFSEFYAVR